MHTLTHGVTGVHAALPSKFPCALSIVGFIPAAAVPLVPSMSTHVIEPQEIPSSLPPPFSLIPRLAPNAEVIPPPPSPSVLRMLYATMVQEDLCAVIQLAPGWVAILNAVSQPEKAGTTVL